MKKCMGCMRDYEEALHACPFCGYSNEQLRRDIIGRPYALEPGQILGERYIVGRPLSLSDYGMVYLAWDYLLFRRVCIREYFPLGLGARKEHREILPGEGKAGRLFEQGLAAFEEEARLLHGKQALEGMTAVFSILHENGTAYSVEEYLTGQTLRDLCEERAFRKKDLLRLLQRLCGMLTSLHRAGLIHGNLSPDSIYIGEDGHLRLIDFGPAKWALCRMMKGQIDLFGNGFCAPEVSAYESLSDRADLYAAGMILSWLLSGREPGRRGIRLKRSDCPDRGLLEAVRCLTEPDEANRPKDLSELDGALAGLIGE